MSKTKTTTQFFGELETTAFVLQISAQPKVWLQNCKIKEFSFSFFFLFPILQISPISLKTENIQNWRQNFPARNQPLWMWMSSLYSPEPKKHSLKCKLQGEISLVRRGKRERSCFFFFFLIGLMVNITTFPQIAVTLKALCLAGYKCVRIYVGMLRMCDVF